MHRLLVAFLLAIMMIWPVGLVRAYTHQYTDTSASVQIKWGTNPITIALSSSLSSPPANVKAGSDVIGAVRRALRRWSDVANIQFVETSSNAQSVSSLSGSNGGTDGISLITVADTPENRTFFSGPGAEFLVGRTRIFRQGGTIIEADLAINPTQQFSTDGTNNTYDLEATMVHEIGHLLGLEHSGEVGATMQPRQGRNGFNNLPATTLRTLSDDDRAGVRAIYGPKSGTSRVGSISGVVTYIGGGGTFGAHVWAESAANGRIVGGNVSRIDGSYRIDALPPGDYRIIVEYLDGPVRGDEIASRTGAYFGIGSTAPFRTAETQATVNNGATTNLNLSVGGGPASLNPRVFGINFFLADSPVPLSPGSTQRFFVGGEGINQVPASGFSVLTPFMSIDQSSFRVENSANFGVSYPIVSFDLTVADTAKVGDYSLRLRAPSGEVAYVTGGITIDPYTNQPELNPIDNPAFFVTLQYRDFLFREPEPAGLNSWLTCMATRPDCDRIEVSASFFRSQEFIVKGFFVYRFYTVSFGQRPEYAKIIPDMQFVTGQTAQEVAAKRIEFTNGWVTRQEFARRYNGVSNNDYVNTLMGRYNLNSITTLDPANPEGTVVVKVTLTRNDLINRLNDGRLSRAQVLRAIAQSDEVDRAESNNAFVAMQYYGYLKRDPEQEGYNAWLRVITNNPNDYRTMVGGFSNSAEYRSRFGEP